MAVSPIDINIMQRSMEVAQIKHNDNMKPMVEQANLVIQTDKNIETRMEQVQTSKESAKSDTKHDAREKGKNFYFQQEQERKKKQKEEDEGRVIKKMPASFDMKI